MKTIVEASTGLSKYIFEDSTSVTINADNITTPTFVVGDLNAGNATMYLGVTPPADWSGNKYFFDGTTWTENPDWVDFDAEEEAV